MQIEGYSSIPAHILRECAAYKIAIPRDVIDYYLPERQYAYRANSQKNQMRRVYFFSKIVGRLTRTPFDEYIDQLPYSPSFDYFLKRLSKENNPPVHYNFVLLDDYIIFIRTPIYLDRTVSRLCKHITIASRATYARFAGEIWCDQHQRVFINNNSGTYRPPDMFVEPALELFRYLSPETNFKGISYQISPHAVI